LKSTITIALINYTSIIYDLYYIFGGVSKLKHLSVRCQIYRKERNCIGTITRCWN